MYDWMDYFAYSKRVKIEHKFNMGKEKRGRGPYPVDGFIRENNTIMQFHGCYWHSHSCWLTKSVKDKKWHKNRLQKYEKTLETTAYLRSKGFNVVEICESEFRNQIRKDSDLKAFVESRLPQTPQRSITDCEILAGVPSGLFGMVEVDISVPDQWPEQFSLPTMSPYEYFEEMSLLFCTNDVPFDIIGSHMKTHVKKFGFSQKPTRLLVGGMKARQILLAIPLLKWYLNHGPEVTKIYQGNAAYGSTIMDQEKIQSVKYVQGEDKAMMEANLPQFRKLTPLLVEEEY